VTVPQNLADRSAPAPAAFIPKRVRHHFGHAVWRLRHPVRRLAWTMGTIALALSVPSALELALPRIVDHVLRSQIGLRVAIGRVEVSVGDMRIRARDLSVGPAQGGPILATIGSVEVVLAPSRILEGLIIERASADDILIHGTRHPDGTIDVIDLIVAARRAKPSDPERSPFPPFVFESVLVSNLRLVVTDETRGRAPRHHGLDLAISAHDLGTIRRESGRAPLGRIFATGSGDAADAFSVEGTLDIASVPEVNQRLEATVRVGGLDPAAVAPEIPGAAVLTRKIGLAGRVVFDMNARGHGLRRDTISFEDVAITADGQAALGLERAAFGFDDLPAKPVVWREARVAKAVIPLERRADGSVALLGFVFPPSRGGAGQPVAAPGAVPAETTAVADDAAAVAASLIDRIEAALRHGAEGGERQGGARRSDVGTAEGADTSGQLASRIDDITAPFDDVVLDGCSVSFRDAATWGAPAFVVRDLSAGIHSRRVLGGRVTGGRIVAHVPGLAREIEVLVSGTAIDGVSSLALAVSARGLEARLIDPYLVAAGRAWGLPGGHLEGEVDVVAKPSGDSGAEPWNAPLPGARVLDIDVHDVVLGDEAGERARVDDLRALITAWTPGRAIHVESVRGSARIAVQRLASGELIVAGLSREIPDPTRPAHLPSPAREAGLEVRVRDAAIALEADVEDDAVGVRARGDFELTAEDLVLGGKPTVGRFALRGNAPGVARSIDARGVVLPSVVTPAAALVLSVELESSLPRAYLEAAGWELLPAEHTVSLGASFASDRAVPAARATIARVTSLSVAGPAGVGASIDAIEVQIRRGADPAVVDVPLVAVRAPSLELQQTAEGLVVARALLRKPGARGTPQLPAPARELRPQRSATTTRVAAILVDGGEVAFVTSMGERIVARDIRARAGPLEIGPGAVHPLAFSVSARATPFVGWLAVTGTVTPPLETPTASLSLRVDGIDLDPVRALVPSVLAGATVHDGRLAATASAALSPLREGGYSGLVSVRDVSFAGDDRVELAGLGEARARILRFDPSSGGIDLASLELDRLRIEAARDQSGHFRVLGVVTAKQVTELTDDDARRRRSLPEGESEAPEAAPTSAPVPARSTRIAIDHFAVADGDIRFVDLGVTDASGAPSTFHVVGLDGTADRIVLGAPPGIAATTRFECDVRFDDGTRIAIDGSALPRGAGLVDGTLECEVRGLDLPRLSPYAQNAADVRLESGRLDATARLSVSASLASGEVEVFARHLRIRSESNNPAKYIASRVGTGVAITLLTDWQGDTRLVIPISGSRVGSGRILRDVFAELILSTLGQPARLLLGPVRGTGPSGPSWRRFLFGPEITAPVDRDAYFAPGDARLTLDGASAVAAAAHLMKEGGHQVRLRADCGYGDRARAYRAALLGRTCGQELFAHLGAERRLRVYERRDLEADLRRALEDGDLDRSLRARERFEAVERTIARLDRSLEELAERLETERTPTVVRGRAEDALRALAAERAETIRRALAAAGVDEGAIRIRPSRILRAGDETPAPGGGGTVAIEVIP
jgi:hypothetical protein